MDGRIARQFNHLAAAAAGRPRIGWAARAVGRVGALAAALGVGTVLGGIGVAAAEESPARPASPSAGDSSADSRAQRGAGDAPAGRASRQSARSGAQDSSQADTALPAAAAAGGDRGARATRAAVGGGADSGAADPARGASPTGTEPDVNAPAGAANPAARVDTNAPTDSRTASALPASSASRAATSPAPRASAALSSSTTGAAASIAAVPTAAAFAVETPAAAVPPASLTAPAPTPTVSVLESILRPLLGNGPAGPIESPVSWVMLALARRLGKPDVDPAVALPAAATAVAAGTTTRITWAWGTDTVLDFDPAADKLDFGWFQPSNFDISEEAGSTRVTVVGNNQSYTLDGVALGALSTANIIARESSTLTKWQTAIDAAAPVVPDTTVPDVTVPDTSVPDTSVPDVSVPDVTVPDTGTPDAGSPDTTPDAAPAARWGETFFAPYVDMGGWPVPDLVAISEATGATLFTAAFLQATPDGKAAWAGIPALEPGSGNEQVENINRSIASLQDAGGDVMISLGGAAGTSLAQYYHARGLGAQELAEAYADVVDTYRISHLDFDIEGAAVAEPASIRLHSQALKLLQDNKPDLQVWYTLPVLPTGLTADGLNVVDSALQAGVDLAGVNVMAMDYGESAAPTSGPNAKTMGAYAIQAAESTHDQLTTLYAGYGKTYDFSQLGVTPMIGVNDVLSEVFTVADAQALEDFARANGLGMLSMWSVTRDNPGTFGQATPIASGLDAPAGSFAGIFADYGTQNTVEASAPGGTPGSGGTLEPGGTTTTITWSWGSDTVLDFDPAADRLDFGWFQPTNFDLGESAGSTRITIVGNQQSYTLSGVALDQMSTANIIALDSATLAKWQNAIGGGTVTTPPAVTDPAEPTTPGDTTVPDTTVPDTTVPDTTVPDTTVPDTTAPDTTVPPVTPPSTTNPPAPPATGGDVDPGLSALPIAAHDKVLAAYFPEWGIYSRDFQVADIPAEQLTHVIYSFLNLTSSGDVVLFDSYAAVDKRFSAAESVSGEADLWYYPPGDPRAEQTVWGNFNQIAQLKEQYPHLKVSAAIGGWTLSGNFSTVTATAAGREKLADSVVDFLQTYPMFDGVDFDWEYPGGGGLESNAVSPQDGENYAALLATLRQKLDVLEQQTGREYEISVAAPGGYDKIANFNAAGLEPSVDFFNLMSYDFHGTWEKTTGHQSAFTGDPNGYDIETAVSLYLAAGVDPSKIVIGSPLYTRGWSGVADGGDGGYLESASGAAPGTFEAGVYDYKDLLAQLQDPNSGWKLYWDDDAQAAYLYDPQRKLFTSFETPTSIAQKAQWAQDTGLGGMMFWDITNDAVGSPESLVAAAYQSWVLDRDITAIRADSALTGERIIGGDGAITALPPGADGSVDL